MHADRQMSWDNVLSENAEPGLEKNCLSLRRRFDLRPSVTYI